MEAAKKQEGRENITQHMDEELNTVNSAVKHTDRKQERKLSAATHRKCC